MEPAPDAQQHPAMPDPARVVSRSIAVLTRTGHSERHGALAVASVAREAIRVLTLAAIDEVGWLEAIAAEAESRYGSVDPSNTVTRGHTHADGSSSSTGRDPQIGARGAQGR